MTIDFDQQVDRRGSNCGKWDTLEQNYGVTDPDAIAMWVADMDLRAPQEALDAAARELELGTIGYYGAQDAYKAAICGWMDRRHGWKVDPSWIATTHGLVAAVAICLHAYSEPGDGVILLTPVYHAFARTVKANDRVVVESPLATVDGRYVIDEDRLEACLTGREKVLVFCSPHNPGGRVWSREELRIVANFCIRHDLVLISDEVHHDLVYPGNEHLVMTEAAPEALDRTVILSAPSKSFNLAGAANGNAIIPDAALRARFAARHRAVGTTPNVFGMVMSKAAYSHGDAWMDALVRYLDGNRKLLDDALNAIPGVRAMPMEATYLSWVDFSGTGMSKDEILSRVQGTARVVANHGDTFGTGGEGFLRFNIATQRAVVADAMARIADAFSDLQ